MSLQGDNQLGAGCNFAAVDDYASSLRDGPKRPLFQSIWSSVDEVPEECDWLSGTSLKLHWVEGTSTLALPLNQAGERDRRGSTHHHPSLNVVVCDVWCILVEQQEVRQGGLSGRHLASQEHSWLQDHSAQRELETAFG
jgi:hypothetical protein